MPCQAVGLNPIVTSAFQPLGAMDGHPCYRPWFGALRDLFIQTSGLNHGDPAARRALNVLMILSMAILTGLSGL